MQTLFYRQKVLLALIQHFEGVLTSTDFQKHLFLYTRLCENKKSYDFVPYRFGCYSFQAVKDKRKLIDIGYLEDTSAWKLTRTGINYISELSRNDDKKMALYLERYGELKGQKLVRHTYKNYPFYAINSEILDETLSGQDLENVINLRPNFLYKTLFATIGYEGLSIEAYLTKLIVNDVRMLIDVRKNPFSRKYGFSKTVLSKLLSDFSIKYKHLPELGIESNDRQSLNRQSDYDALFKKYERTVLKQQIEKVKELEDDFHCHHRIAITCFEESHNQCHRGRIADKLRITLPKETSFINL